MTTLLIALVLAGAPAEPIAGETHGPIMAVGVGQSFGGHAGLSGGYQLRLPFWGTYLTPRASVGRIWHDDSSRTGWSAGATFGYGTRHRGFLDLGGGAISAESVYIAGTSAGRRRIHAVVLGTGYEFVSNSGFYLRLEINSRWRVHPKSNVRDTLFFGDLAGGLGFKL